MRVPLSSALCAALLLGALPAAAQMWGPHDPGVVRDCAVERTTTVVETVVEHHASVIHRHVRVHPRAACAVAKARPPVIHHARVVVHHQQQRAWTRTVVFVCRYTDIQGPDGDRRVFEDHGMPCHDDGMHHDGATHFDGMHHDEGHAWMGMHREQEERWMGAHHDGMATADCGCGPARPWATDRFGYLTWPGKVLPFPVPPGADAQGPWQVHP